MTRRPIEIIVLLLALLIAALAIHAWLAARSDWKKLQSTIATQKKLLDAADARESSRNAALAQTLAQIDKLKRAKQTPAQIVHDLPRYLPLPQAITLEASEDPQSASRQGTALSDKSSPQLGSSAIPPGSGSSLTAPTAQLPAADLKPLYNFVQDCRACQAQLAAAKQNSADDASKIAALTRERDAAITAAKGGNILRRLRRNALWFAAGAAVGYAARARTAVPD